MVLKVPYALCNMFYRITRFRTAETHDSTLFYFKYHNWDFRNAHVFKCALVLNHFSGTVWFRSLWRFIEDCRFSLNWVLVARDDSNEYDIHIIIWCWDPQVNRSSKDLILFTRRYLILWCVMVVTYFFLRLTKINFYHDYLLFYVIFNFEII